MAKRRRSMGSIISMRRRGFGALNQPSSIVGAAVPPLAGGVIAGATSLAVRHYTKDGGSETKTMLFKHAPLVGLGVGGVLAAAMYWLGGKPAAISTGIGALAVAGTQLLHDYVSMADPTTAALEASTFRSVSGLGALAVERSLGRGVGAMLLEPQTSRGYGAGAIGSYGESVNIRGVNAGAFGTPSF